VRGHSLYRHGTRPVARAMLHPKENLELPKGR
jgi:hypothetical protein